MPPTPNPNTQPQPANPNQQPVSAPEQPGGLQPETQPLPATPEAAPTAPAAPPPPPPSAPVVPPVITPPPAMPAPTAPSAAPEPPKPAVTGNPAEAGDVDVIEKAWVDQADKIVEQTKQDPYVEEEAVEALQQDYLKKRYGHDVKKPEKR